MINFKFFKYFLGICIILWVHVHQLDAQTCPSQGLMLHWDFNDDNGKTGGLQDGVLRPKGVAACISATPLTSPKIGNSQPNAGNSGMTGCDTPDPGEQNELMCTCCWNSQTWQDPLNSSSERYIKFSVSFAAGKAGELSSFVYCVQSRDKTINSVGSLNNQFDNNKNKFTGIAVYRNGTKVHEQIGIPITQTWSTITANFSGANFKVDGSSAVTFDFYLEAYGFDLPLKNKSATDTDKRYVTEWDHFRLNGCCGTVAPPCSLSSINPSTQCFDNGTGQSSDDYFRLTINPSGTNTGSTYNYSINPGGITGSGNYGSSKTLTNQFPIGTNLTVTITDVANPSCTRTETVTSPGACSVLPPCSITALNATTQCNNNGTTSNPSDDYFTVSFSPTGSNTGSTYNYVINPGNITGSGTYGTTKNVTNQFQIGTNLTITITDGSNASCTLSSQTVTSPPNCSTDQPCSIGALNGASICNDNGTGSVPGDDYYTVTISPHATGAGGSYTYSISPAPVSGSATGSGNFGSPNSLSQRFAPSTNYTFTITSSSFPGCTGSGTVQTGGTCSSNQGCLITGLGLAVSCRDNNTPTAPGDDYYTMMMFPFVSGASGGYTYTISPAPSSGSASGSGTFGQFNYLTQQFATNTSYSVTVVASSDPTCQRTESIPTGAACSSTAQCTISSIGASSICNDNGTNSNPADDYYVVTLNPVSSGAGTSYNYNISPAPQLGASSGTANFGSTTSLTQRFAVNTTYTITISSVSVSGCSVSGSVTTGNTCSSGTSCTIYSIGASVSCNDNFTGTITGDDYYEVTLFPTGSGISGTYTYTISPAPATGSATGSGTFGGFNILTQQFAVNTNYNFTITSVNDPSCALSSGVNTGQPCSNAPQCSIVSLGAVTVCNDNGTGTVKNDDYYNITINPGSSGAGSTYTYSISPAPLSGSSTGGGSFGTPNTLTQTFAMSTIYSFTITSVATGSCLYNGQVATGGHCSNTPPCEIYNVNAVAYCIENGPNDYIQMVLNPTGVTLPASYNYTIQPGNVTGTGSFGVQQTINNLPLNTPFTVSVVTTTDPLCRVDNHPVAAPPVCPPLACDMTFTHRTECRDNGTPYDGSDDYYRAFITLTCVGCDYGTYNGVASAQAGSGQSFTFPFTGSYGSEVELNYNIPKGVNLDVDIYDDTAGSVCKKENNIVNSPVCKPACLLQQLNASVVCNDNGTLDNPADDFYYLTIDPMGLNTGTTYTYLIMPGNITGGGAYGTPKKLNNRFAIGSNLIVSITDVTEPTCQLLNISVMSPPSCSPFPPCSVTSVGATTLCNDNGSPLNASDDYYLLTLNPVGINLNSTYTYVVNPGNITGTGTTGTPLQLTNHFPIGTNVTVSITDGTIAQCILTNEPVTSPGVCSVQCEFANPNVIRECKTDISGTQKFWRFSFNPSGTNLGNAYYYYVIDRNQATPDTIAVGFEDYGNAIQVSQYYPVATVPSLWLVIADTLDASCTFPMQVFPGTECETCGYIPCNITNIEREIICNGANFSLKIQPEGTGTGYEYTYTINPGNITGTGNYGVPQTITGSFALGTSVSVSVSDVQFPGCTYSTNIQGPTSCSCNLTNIGATTMCNDNGTSLTTADDYYILTLNPVGGTSNGGYTYVINPGNITGQGTHGVPLVLTDQFPIGTHLTVSIYDEINPTCTILNRPVLSPGACSVPNITCDITSPFLDDQLCHDNNTPSNSVDDYISFILNPAGTNVGASYTISVSSGTVSPTSGMFNQPTRFTMSAGSATSGPITVVITDVTGGCQYEFTIIPSGACSCNGTFNISGNPICDGRNTGLIGDDRWFYQFNVSGTNLGSGFNYNVGTTPWQPGDPLPQTGSYGSSITQPSGEVNLIANVPLVYLTIQDVNDPECMISNFELEAPPACSTCDLNDIVFTSICNDNNNSNPADDYWSISLNVKGIGTSGSYNVSGDITASGLSYGSTIVLGNIPINTTSIIITITDANNALCQQAIQVERPGATCTECAIAFMNPEVNCIDNGTPTDYSDDYFTVSLLPTGNYLGSTYQIIGDNFNYSGIPYGTSYQIPMNFPTSEGDLRVFIRDEQNSGCISLNKTLNAPVHIISMNKNILECQNCCTDANPANDVLRVSMNPVGNNIKLVDGLLNQTMYVVDPAVGTVTPAFGFYGTTTVFEFSGFPAGPSDFDVTLRDSLFDEKCHFIENLEVPGCCQIELPIVTNLFCDNNGTPAKITDNRIRLTLLVNNTNGALSNYNVSVNGGTTISPTNGVYGVPTQYVLGPGTAGGGATFQITVTDASGQVCNAALVNIPDPGNCTNTTECPTIKCGSVIIQVNGN